MTLASDLIARVRVRLDEPVAKFWQDAELLTWLNEGLRDAGRHTRHITDKRTVAVTAGTEEATLPAEIIELEHVYWLPGDGRQIPLSGQSFGTMDNVWGSWQNQRTGEPAVYSLWGVPPALKMKLYPIPEQAGTLSMLVVRMPTPAALTSSTLDWPPQWEDVIEDYMEMAALRKARDPRWQEAFNLYTTKRNALDVNGRYDSNLDTFVFDGYAGVVPRWLVDPGY